MQAVEPFRIGTSVFNTSLDTSNASLAGSVGEQVNDTLVSRPLLTQGIGDVVADASRLVRVLLSGSDELGRRNCCRYVHHDASVGTGLDTTTWGEIVSHRGGYSTV